MPAALSSYRAYQFWQGPGGATAPNGLPASADPPLLPESTNLAGTGRRVCARNISGLYRQHPTVGADSGSAVGATGAAPVGTALADGRCGSRGKLEPRRWRRDPHHDPRRGHPRRDGARTGKRGAGVGFGVVWREMPGKTAESRLFARDNWNYREQKPVLHRFGAAPTHRGLRRIDDHDQL